MLYSLGVYRVFKDVERARMTPGADQKNKDDATRFVFMGLLYHTGLPVEIASSIAELGLAFLKQNQDGENGTLGKTQDRSIDDRE